MTISPHYTQGHSEHWKDEWGVASAIDDSGNGGISKGHKRGQKLKPVIIWSSSMKSYIYRGGGRGGGSSRYRKTRGAIWGLRSWPLPLHCSLSVTVWSLWRWASVKGGCLLSHSLDACPRLPAHTLSKGLTTSRGAVKKDTWHGLDTQFHCPTNPV